MSMLALENNKQLPPTAENKNYNIPLAIVNILVYLECFLFLDTSCCHNTAVMPGAVMPRQITMVLLI